YAMLAQSLFADILLESIGRERPKATRACWTKHF
ncbi:MAG: hypothetical protein ACI9JP_002850, partial [Granulosicoccus sp.]